ncbi:MAG: LysM peptidoglycan-binding domain-containing protein [Caldilineaceae bacterium]|nr:LysM peptidoglycan-binding domain-containing protein [Caldilineaceae bacterium]
MQKLTTNLITAMLLTGLAIVFWSQVGNAQSAQCPSNPYIVQAGDTMAKIAAKCGVTFPALRQANLQIVNIHNIDIGDRINIPGRPASGPDIDALLANATYSMLVSDTGYITLRDGHAVRPGPHGQVEVTLMGPSASGDINGDGVTDAATILMEQTANTTGRFYSLHVMIGAQVGLIEVGAQYLQDRIQINSLHIHNDGTIVLDMVTKGPNDPLMGASRPVIQKYALQNGHLVLLSETPPGGNTPTEGDSICPNTYPSRLTVGQQALVLADNPSPKYIRAQWGNAGQVLGEAARGETIVIVSGPRCQDNRVWWYVRTQSGLAGWTSEGSPARYFLSPVSENNVGYGDPAAAVLDYYAAIHRGLSTNDLREAYGYWSNARKSGSTYAGFRNAYADTRAITVHDVTVTRQEGRTATVIALVTTTDWVNQRLVDLHYETTYTLVVEGNQWRVNKPSIKEINQPITTAPDGPPANSFSGNWQSNFAELTINQNGSQVSGNYVRYGDTGVTFFSGTVSGLTLSATNNRGTAFTLRMTANGEQFEGYWRSANGRNYPWCGVRSGKLPDGCGFSGVWRTNHGAKGQVKLEQEGATIRGTYFNGNAEGSLNGRFELFGANQVYSATGTYYAAPNDRGFFRFELVNLDNSEFQGCWHNTVANTSGEWCGWPGQPEVCTAVATCE